MIGSSRLPISHKVGRTSRSRVAIGFSAARMMRCLVMSWDLTLGSGIYFLRTWSSAKGSRRRMDGSFMSRKMIRQNGPY